MTSAADFGTAASPTAYLGVMRVYRQWRWMPNWQLASAAMNVTWPDAAHDARCCSAYACVCGGFICVCGGRPPHPAPSADCRCGIWAYYRPGERWYTDRTPGLIWGAAQVWGRIIPGERGLRAEHARCVALVVPWQLRAAVGGALPGVALYADDVALLADHPPEDWTRVIGRPLPDPRPEPDLGHRQHVHYSLPRSAVLDVQIRTDLARVTARAAESLKQIKAAFGFRPGGVVPSASEAPTTTDPRRQKALDARRNRGTGPRRDPHAKRGRA